MEGVWQQTRGPDASSSEMFIQSHTHTHTHTALLRISCPELRAIPTSCCPIISEPAPYERRGNSGTSSDFPTSRPAKKANVQEEGWAAPANAHPRSGRMGRQIKARAAGAPRARRFVPARTGSLPHISVPACPASCGNVSFCACRLVPEQTAGPENPSKSHRLSSV